MALYLVACVTNKGELWSKFKKQSEAHLKLAFMLCTTAVL